ncbi:MAG: hypothetical protein M1358_13930 [Chloroflexi bacterium]|nr:hypothetical protein [Chloroflexota bacterium]
MILKGTELELEWYKQPKSDRSADLERYYLPIQKGGDRLRQIVENVEVFRAKDRRLADTASRALLINKLSMTRDRNTAFAETGEIWYQPLVEAQSGTEVVVQQKADQLNLYTPIQYYILRKVNGRWYIASNPAPVSP